MKCPKYIIAQHRRNLSREYSQWNAYLTKVRRRVTLHLILMPHCLYPLEYYSDNKKNEIDTEKAVQLQTGTFSFRALEFDSRQPCLAAYNCL